MPGACAIVIIQREIDGIDPAFIAAFIVNGMGFTDGIGRGRLEFLFQGAEKRTEDVHHETLGSGDDFPDIAVYNGVEHQRPCAVCLGRLVDPFDHFPGFFFVRNVGNSNPFKLDLFELGQKAVPESLGCQAGAIRNEKSSAFHAVLSGSLVLDSWLGGLGNFRRLQYHTRQVRDSAVDIVCFYRLIPLARFCS